MSARSRMHIYAGRPFIGIPQGSSLHLPASSIPYNPFLSAVGEVLPTRHLFPFPLK